MMCCSLPHPAPSSLLSVFVPNAKPPTLRNTFRVTGAGTIAGCYVTDGVLNRTAQIRVVRDGVVINTSKLSSLKRFKDDASEVRTGFECGVGISNFNDVKIGDVLEAFSIQKVSGAEAAAAQSGASARR